MNYRKSAFNLDAYRTYRRALRFARKDALVNLTEPLDSLIADCEKTEDGQAKGDLLENLGPMEAKE